MNGHFPTIDSEVRDGILIPQTIPETPKVDRMLGAFRREWEKTADECVKRAIELEEAAADLRNRAGHLLNACGYLDDVKQATVYEIDSRERVNSLMFVNPSDHSDKEWSK